MSDSPEHHVLRSWQVNAAPWTEAIASGAVRSRVLVTNAAIVDAVLASSPQRVLDVGCGEGWLCRALRARGVTPIGFDAIPSLIERARALDSDGDYRELAYEAATPEALDDLAGTLDAAVCNFSLIGEAAVERVLRTMAALLAPRRGALTIQTLHPFALLEGDGAVHGYRDGWRAGSWAGFSDAFTDPAPWYARTVGGWTALLRRCGFHISDIREPLHPETGRPASFIVTGEVLAASAQSPSCS